MSNARCFFGHLPRDAREGDLSDFLSDFRGIREITIKNGYGFVEFASYDDAHDCVKRYDGKTLLGERRSRRGYTMVVENLPSQFSWQDLKDEFRPYGQVNFADVDTYRREGIVEFAYEDDMERCIRKCDGTKLHDETVRLRVQRGSGRDRERDRSRSRGRYDRDRHDRDRYDNGRHDDRYNGSRGERRGRTRSPRARAPRSPSPFRGRSPPRARDASPFSSRDARRDIRRDSRTPSPSTPPADR